MTERERWTVAQVAAHWGVAESTVRAYLTRGQMPAADGRLGRTPWWWADTIRRHRGGAGQQRPAGVLHRAEGVMPDGAGGVTHWRDTGDGIEYTRLEAPEG